MPNKIITIQLQSVEYGGDNLGDDIRLDLTVNGASTVIRGAINHGTTRTFWKALYRFQSTNNTVRIPVSAMVSEEDIVYNDAGSASGSLTVDLNGGPNQTLQSLKVNVIGSGDGKVAHQFGMKVGAGEPFRYDTGWWFSVTQTAGFFAFGNRPLWLTWTSCSLASLLNSGAARQA